MIEIRFQPGQWTGPQTKHRKPAAFKASYDNTLRLLDDELRRLGAKNVHVLVDADERYFRRDGILRGDAQTRHPGVIVSFDSKHGPLYYPCDTYWNFTDNLRAIALALEHLRAVDRYGVTRRGEQYTGWARLPAPAAVDGFKTVDEAAKWLAEQTAGVMASTILVSTSGYEQAWRAAAKKLHPDVQGGVTAGFQKLQQARELIEKFLSNTSRG